jgi:hypothetical protein
MPAVMPWTAERAAALGDVALVQRLTSAEVELAFCVIYERAADPEVRKAASYTRAEALRRGFSLRQIDLRRLRALRRELRKVLGYALMGAPTAVWEDESGLVAERLANRYRLALAQAEGALVERGEAIKPTTEVDGALSGRVVPQGAQDPFARRIHRKWG